MKRMIVFPYERDLWSMVATHALHNITEDLRNLKIEKTAELCAKYADALVLEARKRVPTPQELVKVSQSEAHVSTILELAKDDDLCPRCELTVTCICTREELDEFMSENEYD